jgi:hypothetical protein
MNTLPTSPLAATSQPLPVLDLCNNLLTISGYLSNVTTTHLPDIVVASNPSLATQFGDWQQSIWQSFFESLVNANIFAQAEEIQALLNDDIDDQAAFQSTINDNDGVPGVISRCDDIEGQINLGSIYVSHLKTIASSIEQADKEKVEQLQQIVSELNSQFDSLEDKFSQKSIDESKEIVATTINVGVAVASKKEPISPLLSGVAQVAFDVVEQISLSEEITATLNALEKAWNQLDEATQDLAQIKLLENQLIAVSVEQSKVINNLNNIVNDWQVICNLINDDSTEKWRHWGLKQLKEWSVRMNRISFYGSVSQVVSPNA